MTEIENMSEEIGKEVFSGKRRVGKITSFEKHLGDQSTIKGYYAILDNGPRKIHVNNLRVYARR